MNAAPTAGGEPLGATRVGDGQWSFVVWAPGCDSVAVRLYDGPEPYDELLSPADGGYFSGVLNGVATAPSYRLVLDAGEAYADPASRWQPEGVHGPSRGFDPGAFTWTDSGFARPRMRDAIIYELHVGTFTDVGTFDAAADHLSELVDLGVTVVEIMPVAAFPGARNWGYDGVFPFAVQESYGGPEAFQRFVDRCHQAGLAVILDVVYNHLGPEGAVHEHFAPYFTDVYETPWGAAVNVAESGSDEVRRYFIDNATMWVRDFHVDGLRFDAIHGIVDPTASPFLAELTSALDEVDSSLLLIAESADNNPKVISPRATSGLGFHGQWNDDFHHSLHALLTGERDGYYQDFGTIDQLAHAINDGFAYDGQYSAFRGRRHGVSSHGISADRFVVYSQNHDQIGNRPGGDRLNTVLDAPRSRLAAAVVLLSPFVPLLFMGEEYAETAPFPYFIDHSDPELVEKVRRGRASEFDHAGDLLDPADPETYARARLDRQLRDGPEGKSSISLYEALIAARKRYPVVTEPSPALHAAVVEGDLIALLRNAGDQAMLAVFNTGAESVTLPLPSPERGWQKVLDGDTLDGVSRIAESLELAAYGFALCISTREDNGATS